jgi:hypothetical protein
MTLRWLDTPGASRALVGMTAAIVTAAACLGLAKGSDDDRKGDERHSDSYTIALFGDMPYNVLGRAQYPALLDDINAKHVAFSVFDGDLKSGGDGPCSDTLYTTAITNFNMPSIRRTSVGNTVRSSISV